MKQKLDDNDNDDDNDRTEKTVITLANDRRWNNSKLFPQGSATSKTECGVALTNKQCNLVTSKRYYNNKYINNIDSSACSSFIY
ncbi:CLUMA_CG013707, isoform A [Clunio marinus]|uniref:CLUMA_CG013707, isoform A n=1 Tax=Clunio marinus TaxID=568069 RepID=A0A1J1IJN4_9DIPT|nr:CLUMA_CG013707, isoform A [Clunio marinus]